jgi:hypothetical protein
MVSVVIRPGEAAGFLPQKWRSPDHSPGSLRDMAVIITQCHQLGDLNNRHLFFPVLGAACVSPGCLRGLVIVTPPMVERVENGVGQRACLITHLHGLV